MIPRSKQKPLRNIFNIFEILEDLAGSLQRSCKDVNNYWHKITDSLQDPDQILTNPF